MRRRRTVPLLATCAAVATSVAAGLAPDRAAAAGDASPEALAPEPVRATLIGDSLAVQSAPFAVGRAAHLGADLAVEAFGGTAPCDWLGRVGGVPAPDVVVISFVGNDGTPCMRDADGGQLSERAVVDRYRADVTALIDSFPDSLVVLVGQPPIADEVPGHERTVALTSLYRSLAAPADDRVEFVDGATTLRSRDGRFLAAAAPRDDVERAAGTATVDLRAGDGVHFVQRDGSAYGARRFPLQITDAVASLFAVPADSVVDAVVGAQRVERR